MPTERMFFKTDPNASLI